MSKPTLEDVAMRAGVSKMTASRALRNAPDVSPESAVRVHAAAVALGYVRNRLALSLNQQRSSLIGVVVPSMSNIVFPEVVSGISAALEGSPMQAVFGISDYDEAKERDIIRSMLSWQPSAMIVTGLDQPDETRQLLAASSIPIIQIMDLDGDPIWFNVGLSHSQAGADIALALIKAGRRKFAYIGSALTKDLRANKRKSGFETTLAQSGMRFEAASIADSFSSISLGKILTHQMLEGTAEIDCIYYSNDDMAAGGLFACMERAIAVPETIMLAGFNGLDLTAALPAIIATSRSPRRLIGQTAAELALKAIANDGAELPTVISFEPEIILGKSGPWKTSN